MYRHSEIKVIHVFVKVLELRRKKQSVRLRDIIELLIVPQAANSKPAPGFAMVNPVRPSDLWCCRALLLAQS